MSSAARLRVAAAIVVAVAALAGMIVLVARIRSDESGVGRLGFAATSPAAAPFGEFSQARVAVGSRCLHLLVALSPSQRVQGLRGVESLAPYDGMLFVSQTDSTAHFTMADTVMPLDITFFSDKGVPVDRTRMVPCPSGSDSTCPEYASKQRYRFALEQPANSSAASGALASCA